MQQAGVGPSISAGHRTRRATRSGGSQPLQGEMTLVKSCLTKIFDINFPFAFFLVGAVFLAKFEKNKNNETK